MQNSPSRTWDWLAAGLTIGIVTVAAMRLAATNWAHMLYFGENMAIAGVCLGLWIGYARLSKLATRLALLNYTLIFVPWQFSLLAPNNLSVIERFYDLAPRIAATWTALIGRRPYSDTILFIALVTLGFWLVGLASGIALTRRRDLLSAILPSGLILLIVQVYDPKVTSRTWYLAAYFFMALALIGRQYYLNTRENWRTGRVFQLPETARDLSSGLMITSALVVLIAWSLPVSISSWKTAEKFWGDLTKPLRPAQERISDALDPLESAYGNGRNFEFYGKSITLGNGVSPSEDILFTVKAPQAIGNAPPRFYWRGRVFSAFDGVNWVDTTATTQTYTPNQDFSLAPELAGLETATFEVKLNVKQALVFAPAQPIAMDHPGLITYDELPGSAREVVAFEASPAFVSRQTYKVQAALVNPSIADMLTAGTDYPSWVTETYLQIPGGFSPRILDLAQQITAGSETPYEKTALITTWLRSNIEFQDTIDPAPQGQNPLEWVLFESKQGFCVYYASAEVLMLRSLGVPARLAVGFAEGERTEPQQGDTTITYTVRRKDYHAWPEVFFPNIGWVEFEPTAGQDELIRPSTDQPVLTVPTAASPATPVPTPEGGLLGNDRALQETDLSNIATTPWYVTYRGTLNRILVLLILTVLWLYNLHSGWVSKIPHYLESRAAQNGSTPPRWIHAWAAWTRLSPLERSFESVNFSLRSFGERLPIHASAGERAKALISLLPAARNQVQILTERHQAALFTREGPSNLREARQAATSIILHTIWARLIKWWQSILNFIGV